MKLSKHSKLRMKERVNIKRKQLTFYRSALRNGISAGETKDERLKKYLLSKENNHTKAKVYKGYIFLHSKNSKLLYTVYKLPDRFGGG